MPKDKRETLCWTCDKTVLNCSWMRDEIPVHGWEIGDKTCILQCPNYKRIPRKIRQTKEVYQ